MGNQATRTPLNSIKDKQLNEIEQVKLEELLFHDDQKEFNVQYKQFQDKYGLRSLSFTEMFPVRSEFNPKDGEDKMTEDRHLLNQVI